MLDPSPAKLITAIEENMYAFLPVFGKLGQAYENDPAGVKRSITDIPIPLFNSVMGARLAPGHVDAAIQCIVSDARSRNVPMLWWIGPSTRPVDLGRQLEKKGFSLDDEAPGMAIDLAKMNANLPALEGFSIKLAQDDVSWGQWSSAMALGFEVPPSYDFFLDAWHNLLRHVDPETTLAYTGWMNDKPVATSLLFLSAGVAGIYSVATIPEARRKGIGALITQYPLLQASSLGYQIGILQSSEMGLSIYRSLGFKEYCKISMYRWQPERENAG